MSHSSPSSPTDVYYIPHGSPWPLVGSVALFCLAIGFGALLNTQSHASLFLIVGGFLLFIMLFFWFRDVIHESVYGCYNAQVDRSFRWGMSWFIFSEVMFFAAFFGALFYARVLSVPWLGGAGSEALTQQILWPYFDYNWPLMRLPADEASLTGAAFDIPRATVGAWGIPALNTAILLASGVTITWAHWGLIANKRGQLILGLFATVLLGVVFMGFQVYEYGHAMEELNLTLQSGIYGSTFYMLTGFHGFHVSLGVLMLVVILLRSMTGHFSAKGHFAFEAVAWYWHFVDVVWLGLFIFVYVI